MKSIFTLLFLSVILLSCTPENKEMAYQPIEYNLFFGGNKAGYFISGMTEDGAYRYEMEYNDRGRGPHLEETIRLNSEGFPESIEILGHNYLKDTVSETFGRTGDKVQWKSTSEQGSATSEPPAFYVGANSSYGNAELLVRKMLASPEQSTAIYPSGKLHISSATPMSIGDTLNLKLIEVVGYGFSPTYYWFDTDNRFFAAPSSWLTAIRTGYESLSEELLALQLTREKAYYAKTAAELTQTPAGTLVISNVTLFDPKSGDNLSNRHVVVKGNTIEAVLNAQAELPEGAEVIDGTGKTLLPGLFDMHTHLGRSDGILNLAAGVTSVRDLANSFDLPDIRNEFNENSVIGPRILVMSGFIDQAGPYAGPIGKIISSLEEGLEAIDFYKERGYHQIKLYSSIDPAWVKPLAEKAHSLGLRVSGHIPAHMLAGQAVADGYDEIQHINMIALNFMSDTIDTRTPLRFSMIGKHAHEIDVEGAAFQDFVKLLKSRNTVIDPTVSIFEGMLTTRAGEPDPMFVEILDRLPVQVSRGFYSGGLPIPEGQEMQYKESYASLLEMIRALHEAGITLVPGTDAMSGFSLHNELENYVKAGISNADVLKMATITSAEVSGYGEQLGSIEAGKWADLILIDGNPLNDISDIRRVILTIKDGKIYTSKELYEAIGVRHFE